MSNITHRDVLAGLPGEERKALLKQSNVPGLLRICFHLGAIMLGALLITLAVPGWQVLLVLQGVFIVFLFTALHEAIHRTAFRSDWLNLAVANLCGFPILIAPVWFRYFHFTHHRFTHEPGKDPELAEPKPRTMSAYLWYLSGIPLWASNIRVLVRNGAGLGDEEFVPSRGRSKVTSEARWFLAGYAGLIGVSIWFWNAGLFWVWVFPSLLGQPFLRGYLLAEHTRCPHVANMLENTRTTFTTAFVRLLAWNMPYHIEHHTYPAVPFHKLPAFHQILKDHLGCTQDGYARFHRDYVGAVTGSTLD